MSTAIQGNLAAQLLAAVRGTLRATVTATEPGIIAGLGFVDPSSAPSSVGQWRIMLRDGDSVEAGTVVVELLGAASELAVAEDYVMGPLGFASGIATRAQQFVKACPPGLKVACGGWKKLPAPLKPLLRAGLAAVGVLPRLVEGDFVYVNKNAVLQLGGVGSAIAAGRSLGHGPVAVQVRDTREAVFAAQAGAGIVMVDTARIEDLAAVHDELKSRGLRRGLILAFGGGVNLEDLAAAAQAGAEVVDVGRAILNAPLLDFRLEVFA